MVVVRFAALGTFVAFVLACTPHEDSAPPPYAPTQKQIALEGEACTPQGIPRCTDGLVCKEQPYQKPVIEAGARRPEDPNDVGGSCGGVVGYHCAEGLDCTMAQGREMVADGMGTCTLHGICIH